MDFPYVVVSAYDVTNVDDRSSVELRFGGESLSGVSEQDVVDAVKAVFSAQPNVSVSALRYEVSSTAV
jgi:hypothetical protein